MFKELWNICLVYYLEKYGFYLVSWYVDVKIILWDIKMWFSKFGLGIDYLKFEVVMVLVNVDFFEYDF